MRKSIFILILSILSLSALIIIYLNIYGIKTSKFNDLINKKIKEVHPQISLDIKDVYLKLNLNEQAIKLNTKNVKVLLDKDFIDLSNVDINLNLIEFLRNEHSLKNIKMISKENSIKSVTKFLNSYKFNLPRFVFFNQIENGTLQIKANVYFDTKKKTDFTYAIEGVVKNTSVNFFNNNYIRDISFDFNIKDQIYNFDNITLQYENLKIKSKKIIINKTGKNFEIKGNLKNEKALVKPDIISGLFNLNLDYIDNKEILLETDNNFSFNIDHSRSIKNLSYKSNITFDKIFINKKYQELIFLKNGKIETAYSEKNLDIKINSNFAFLNDEYNNQEDENDIIININKNKKKDANIQVFLKNKQSKLNSKEILKYFQFKDEFFKEQEIIFGSDNKASFEIDKKNKIRNLKIKSILNFDKVRIDFNSNKLKKLIPDYKNLIFFNADYVELDYSKNKTQIKANGKYSINDKFDNFQINLINRKNKFDFETKIDLLNNSISIKEIDYSKGKNIPSKIVVKGNYKINNNLEFKNIDFSDNKNKIIISNLILSKNYKVKEIDKIELNYLNNYKIKNFIKLYKNETHYELAGDHFYGKSLVNNLLNGDSNNNFLKIFKNLNSEIIINLDKLYLDEQSSLDKIEGKLIVKNNKIDSGKINALLNNKNKFALNVKTNPNNEKVTNLYIDQPAPFIKNYKFIKGFDKGSLSYDSIEKNGISRSNLKIYDFKVKKVPVLAKLLSLASLQGIADLLTGEGIRFDEFEMEYETKNKLTKIHEMYAIGPAISMLMEGYIEKEKITSLKGTLVPATTINKTISKIPLLGNILVGKKIGEGVFGVSFKIKGPPNKLKTVVNPIKTLTPRFITRTIEKLKTIKKN